jgi:hypothetical protein
MLTWYATLSTCKHYLCDDSVKTGTKLKQELLKELNMSYINSYAHDILNYIMTLLFTSISKTISIVHQFP